MILGAGAPGKVGRRQASERAQCNCTGLFFVGAVQPFGFVKSRVQQGNFLLLTSYLLYLMYLKRKVSVLLRIPNRYELTQLMSAFFRSLR